MHLLPKKGAIWVITIGLTLQPTAIFSVSVNQDYPLSVSSDFNPNFLLSDEELTEYQSMDRADIQAFFVDNGGNISRLRTDDKDGTKRTADDIIYRAAQEHNINPKYLLVKLQKEQSLVTDPNPTKKQLDGATGYGITDGCGWWWR